MEDMTTLPLPASRQRGAGRLLRQRARSLAQAAVTPLDLDDLLDHFHPLRRGAELSGRVVEVRPETAASATLVIKPGRDWAGHVPGQYVRVGVDVDGVRLWRTYSLTHGPRPDGCISITVKAIDGGVVSGHLVRRTRPGTMLRLAQAAGDFVLPDPLPGKLLLVTAGSGITPVIGMLRNLFSRAEVPASDIVLIHSALSQAEVIFVDGGYEAAARFIWHYWAAPMAGEKSPPRDAKSALQEFSQAQHGVLPVYRLIARQGPAHAPHFEIEARIANLPGATASGW